MAFQSAKSRLVSQLSRTRSSSPHADDFATANSTNSFAPDNAHIINSTANFENHSTQQPLPATHLQPPEDELSERGSDGSEGSARMSIELGRGVPRNARGAREEYSSNVTLNLGDDSLYEITATPPSRPKTAPKKSYHELRRQAPLRRATEAARGGDAPSASANLKKPRTLSEALAKAGAEGDPSSMIDPHRCAPVTAKNTRFAPSRYVSGESAQPNGGAKRPTSGVTTVQSTAYTSNSFILPDLPNITELVSGVHKDGTPIFSRQVKSRSRFTSGSYNSRSHHIPLDGVPIPEEEKAIYSSLQLLKDRVAELERTNAEAQKRAEEYEDEIIDLRSQLDAAQRRPDSALGSDEEGNAEEKWRVQKTKWQTSVKALQDRLDRSKRKASVSEITVNRITKERDALIAQIGVAYYNNEELKLENENLRDSHAQLQAGNEHLRDEVQALRNENLSLKEQLRLISIQHGSNRNDPNKPDTGHKTAKDRPVDGTSPRKQRPSVRSRRESQPAGEVNTRTTHPSDIMTGQDLDMPKDLATAIAQEVQKHREEAAVGNARRTQRPSEEAAKLQSRLQSENNELKGVMKETRPSGARRSASGGEVAEAAHVGTKICAERPNTHKIHRNNTNSDIVHPSIVEPREDDTRDITYLSFLDPDEVANLRKKLEEELRAKRTKRNFSALAQVYDDHESTLGRQSSLKDVLNNDTRRFSIHSMADEQSKVPKSVRVQSPHSSSVSQQHQAAETADASMLSNTSRRRRRAASSEGMTSAFIIPDITLRGTHIPAAPGNDGAVEHQPATCTACHGPNGEVEIPEPVPIGERVLPQDVDITTATVRPAQPPPRALATVIKQVQDEITHLKLQLQVQQRLYNQHDPALSKRKRLLVKSRIERLTAEIEKRSDQIYALYDVLEGQRQQAASAEKTGKPVESMNEREVEETLTSIGIDPVEMSGRIGRQVPVDLDGVYEMRDDEGEELPWDGLSDYQSESDREEVGAKNRISAAI